MRLNPDKCPKCGGEPMGIVQIIPGCAEIIRQEDGSFEWNGSTNVWWDDQTDDETDNGKARVCCDKCFEIWEAERTD